VRSGVAVGPDEDVAEVGDEADGGERLSAGDDLQPPLQGRPDRRRRRRDGPLEAQALGDEAPGVLGVAEF
jgi:hypothetical protein